MMIIIIKPNIEIGRLHKLVFAILQSIKTVTIFVKNTSLLKRHSSKKFEKSIRHNPSFFLIMKLLDLVIIFI